MSILETGRAGGWRSVAISCVAVLGLAGCTEDGQFNLFQAQPEKAEHGQAKEKSVKLVERDVEAPEAFQVTDMGLWDGRPSLGGVWVAHPDVGEPERVIIRNTENSNFVIGALFRRERQNPGPILQVSSDAAAALGMLAGSPAQLNVTALRREAAEIEEPQGAAMVAETEELAAPETVEATILEPIAGAAAAIEAAEGAEATAAAAQAVEPAPQPQSQSRTSPLDKPYIQIGIFSIEQNAEATAASMRQAGMIPTVRKQSSQGKTFWRVIVGPANSKSERSALLKKIKGVGFEDAYAVTN